MERRRPIELVRVTDGIGDLDLTVLADDLLDQLHREERCEIAGPDRLTGSGVERRRRRARQVRGDVVPGSRDAVLVEQEAGAVGQHGGHDGSPLGAARVGMESLDRLARHRNERVAARLGVATFPPR